MYIRNAPRFCQNGKVSIFLEQKNDTRGHFKPFLLPQNQKTGQNLGSHKAIFNRVYPRWRVVQILILVVGVANKKKQ